MGLKRLLAQGIIWRSFYFFSVLLVNIFLSRYLQAAGTGSLYLTIVIFSFAQIVLSLGADAGVVYFAAGNVIERNKLVTLSAVWALVAGLLILVLTYAYFSINNTAEQSLKYWYCAFSFLFVCGQSLAGYSLAIYYSRENYFKPNLFFGIINFIYVFFIPGKNAGHNISQIHWVIFFYFATFFVGGLLAFISYLLQYKKEGAFKFPGGAAFIKMVRYSVTALGANAVFFLVYKIDYLFVNYSPVCTPADLGNYIQVSKIGQLMLTIPQIIASVVFPRTASGGDAKNLSNAIMTMARIFSQIFLVMFIGVAIIGKQFFILVFGESFNNMQIPMLIIIPGIFSLSILVLLSAYFAGRGNVKINLYGAIIGLAVMITGDFIFVPRYGIIAAAAISTLSYMSNVGFSMWHFYRDYSIHWFEFFRWKKSDYNWLLNYLKLNSSAS